METVATASAAVNAVKTQVHATELPHILNHYKNVSILSLDCFDTLLWRKTMAPQDVFFDLQNHPTFQALDITAKIRMTSEHYARQMKLAQHNISEVTLQDIYLAGIPTLSQTEIDALSEAELASEMEACYQFAPIVQLIRDASARGLKVIIVSDTYLTEPQLRRLLSHLLPKDVMNAIFKIFCSSEHGRSKSRGLFNIVLEKLYEKPRSLLHIGDNLSADLIAAKQVGLEALQLLHAENYVADIIRMGSLSHLFFDPTTRHCRALTSPFRSLFAAKQYVDERPESQLGYAALGPIMYAFAKFILDEAKEIEQTGKRVKILFLLRDGYLPAKACEALHGSPIGYTVRISRFAAFASSFRTKEDIYRYLSDTAPSLRFDAICQQLLLSEKLAHELEQQALASQNPAMEFIRLIKEDTLALIMQNSSAYRARFMRYLEKEIGLQKGDTLMFVDLGYTGTAQRELTPILKDEMDVDIIGRYFLAMPTPNWRKTRKGLLDPSWCDPRLLATLVTYIALLEQLSTVNDGSVVDYDEAGNTILAKSKINENQQKILDNIQAECLTFIHHARDFLHETHLELSQTILRDAALASLARLLFLPTASEIAYLKTFQFDLNLGTEDMLQVFDQEKGLEGLKRRGLFFMEKNLKTMRTNYPAELRAAGLELSLFLMAQNRFGLDIRPHDLSLRREELQVLVIRGMGQTSQFTLQATPTHDGYFAILVPVGTGNIQIGILFGMSYAWVQLESAELIKTALLMSSQESENTVDASANLAIDGMMDKGGGLFECQTQSGMLVYASSVATSEHNQALRVVFRPVVMRDTK